MDKILGHPANLALGVLIPPLVIALTAGVLLVLSLPLRLFRATREPHLAVGIPALLLAVASLWFGSIALGQALMQFGFAGVLVGRFWYQRDERRGIRWDCPPFHPKPDDPIWGRLTEESVRTLQVRFEELEEKLRLRRFNSSTALDDQSFLLMLCFVARAEGVHKGLLMLLAYQWMDAETRERDGVRRFFVTRMVERFWFAPPPERYLRHLRASVPQWFADLPA